MIVTVREGAVSAPVLSTRSATSVELRDPISGRLALLILMLPGDPAIGSQNFLVTNCNEPGFAETIKGLGFKP